MWIELNHNVGGMGADDFKPVLVNMDQVKKVSSASDGKAGSKVVFSDGNETIRVSESYDKIKAILQKELEGYYVAPDPKVD